MSDLHPTTSLEERHSQTTDEQRPVPDAVPRSWVAEARRNRRLAVLATVRDALRPQPGDSWRRVRN